MNIDVIKRKLLVKYPFFGSVIANSKIIEVSDIPTACTDGTNIYYNYDFLKDLNENQQIFIFAHEISHIAFNHIERSKDKNLEAWNIATDGVINALLKNDGLELVEGSVDIPEAINFDAEELYNIILERMKNNPSYQEGNNDEETKTPNAGHDDHSQWGKNKEKEQQDSKEEKNKEGQPDFVALGEKETFKKNQKIKEENLKELRKSLINNSYGKEPGNRKRDISDIGTSLAIIDWRRVLKETLNYNVDWSYQNATIEEGVITPQLEEYPIPETEIVLDTSGSIDSELLKAFLRECKNILQNSKVKVGCFDTVFYGFTEVRTIEDIDNLEFQGWGGTDFNAAINAFSRRVDNKIIFTDGRAPMPSTPCDAIWIVFDNEIKPLGGKVISVSSDDLIEREQKRKIRE